MNAIIGNAAVGRNNTQTTKDETKRDKGHKKTRLRSSRMADNSTLMVAPPPPFAHPLHTLCTPLPWAPTEITRPPTNRN